MTDSMRLFLTGLGCLAVGAGAVGAWRAQLPSPSAPACRSGAAPLARVDLLFGTSGKDGSTVAEADWQAFLDSEVTPRFPDGLTVLSGTGQWLSGDRVRKEGSRVLIIFYQRAADSDDKIDAIRSRYKMRFQQESVMRVDGLSCVAF